MAPNILQQTFQCVGLEIHCAVKPGTSAQQPYITFTEMNENIPDAPTCTILSTEFELVLTASLFREVKIRKSRNEILSQIIIIDYIQ